MSELDIKELLNEVGCNIPEDPSEPVTLGECMKATNSSLNDTCPLTPLIISDWASGLSSVAVKKIRFGIKI